MGTLTYNQQQAFTLPGVEALLDFYLTHHACNTNVLETVCKKQQEAPEGPMEASDDATVVTILYLREQTSEPPCWCRKTKGTNDQPSKFLTIYVRPSEINMHTWD